MNDIYVLVRKHLGESRWVLAISAAAFFGLSVLTCWIAMRVERVMDSGEFWLGQDRYRFVWLLGGTATDLSTTALEVCWWNHPLIVLTTLAWAVSRGSAGVAGEIERGTIDLTLSRPVGRSTYLASQILFAVLGLVVLAACLIAGSLAGRLFFTLKAPPTVLTLLRPAAMVVALGMSVYGYTLPFSAVDVARWRPALAAASITLGGLIAMALAPMFEGYDWLEKLSVFQAYAPVTVALKGEPLGYNATVLCSVFAAGVVLSFVVFSRRDIPSNS
jgi:ABC-2 type transport system permease protein